MEQELANQLIGLLDKIHPSYIAAGDASDAHQAARSSVKMLIQRAADQMTSRSVKCARDVSKFVRSAIPEFQLSLSCKDLQPYRTGSGRDREELGYTVTVTASGGWGVLPDYSAYAPASMVLKKCKFGFRIAEGGFEAVAED